MMKTVTNKCSAAVPAACRYHGVANLKQQADTAAQKGETAKFLSIKEQISELERITKERHQSDILAGEPEAINAAESFNSRITAASYAVKQISPQEYEIEGSENMQDFYDSLEDDEVEVRVNEVVSGYDVIESVDIPALNITLRNSNLREELRDIPANDIPDGFWYEG